MICINRLAIYFSCVYVLSVFSYAHSDDGLNSEEISSIRGIIKSYDTQFSLSQDKNRNVMIGQNNYIFSKKSDENEDDNLIVGFRNQINGERNIDNVIVGVGAKAEGVEGVAVGVENKIGDGATALGVKAESKGLGSVSVGYTSSSNGAASASVGRAASSSGNFSSAIGALAKSEADNSVAIGSYSIATRKEGLDGYLIDTEKDKKSPTWKATRSAVSIGSGKDNNAEVTRQITYLAAGTEDTDAVNVAQLKRAIEKANSKPGKNGKSAYEIAKENGKTDAEDEAKFIDSLKGKDGNDGKSAYEIAKENGKTDAEDEAKFIDSLKGKDGNDGKSAYEFAMDGGYIGSQSEFINNISSIGNYSKKMDHMNKDIKLLRDDVNKLDSRVNNLNKRINRGIASAAALSGLLQPYGVGNFNLTAAIGNYRSENAFALGIGYRATERFAIRVGVAYTQHDKPATNIGTSYEW